MPILTVRKMSRGSSESRFAAIFGDIGRLRSSVLDLRTLNQTTAPFFVLTSSEPVSPGITITGFFPWAATVKDRTVKKSKQTAARITEFPKVGFKIIGIIGD
jgi:hypothetical protein